MITYTLWAGNGRYRVSAWFCSYRERSRTICDRAMGDTESVQGSALIQQDHIQTVGEQWERRESACGSTVIQHDYVPTVGGQWALQSA